MTKRTFLIATIVAAVALVGTVGLTVIATGDGSADQAGGFIRHLHEMGHRLHHGDDHQEQLAQLIEQLELTPEQNRHLERVHELIGSYGSETPRSMAELHDRLMVQFEQGDVESDEIREAIDGHVEQIREMAYAVTDELTALVNGLDATQREIVSAHLAEIHEGRHGNGDDH